MQINCPRCGVQVLPVPMGGSAGCGPATDARVFDVEPPGVNSEHPHLRLVPHARSLEVVRRELLEAHKAHVAASDMQDAADKAARLAGHNTVEKMARIQQLRNELVRLVEQPEACAS